MQREPEQTPYTLDNLLRIVQRLRDPEHGCPWDLAQDFQSIAPSTLEECYELVAAIEAEDYPHLEDELGDVLFQVVFYAQLGRERDLFDFASVVHRLADKLLRRHPHVFADARIEGVLADPAAAARVQERWETIKAAERADRDQHGALDDVPLALAALPRAQKLQRRAARVGFDWPDAPSVQGKVDEEWAELRAALAAGDTEAIAEEFGDLLFTLANLGRHLKLDSETALRRASAKFEQRFRRMEAAASARGVRLENLGDSALDELWEAAKTAPEASASRVEGTRVENQELRSWTSRKPIRK